MNSKAIKKQLLAAVAMVLVAAVALGSSTYAWFVASGTVTAEGMKVQARAEGGLAIRWAGVTSELWATSASAKMETAQKLLPASTADLAKWTYAKALDASKSDADTKTYADVTKVVYGGESGAFKTNDYVVMQPFEVRSTSESKLAKGLYVSGVTVDRTQNKDLDPALRVGVRMVSASGDVTAKYIYAPIEGHSDSYSWKDASNGNNATDVALEPIGDGTNGKSQLASSTTPIPFDKGQAVKVQVFIWYEGEDATLFSNNYAANDLNVTVAFTSNELTA
mgnify:FL=1